jgi:DNA-binding transcriptional ArsR family regulator
MPHAPQIAEVAALVGDPARANMLCALLGGRALTATELSAAAGVSPQTTSGHLGKLFTARLVVLMKQGRLLSARRTAGRAYAGKHHERRARRAAALSAQVQDR